MGSNTPITGVLERQNHKGGAEKVLEEIMTKNFPKLERNINIEIQEAGQILKKNKQTKSMPKHIVILRTSKN